MEAVDIEKLNRVNFRAMMNSLSMPGKIEKIEPLFDSSFLAISNTLLYSEVSFFYEGEEEFELIKAITNPKSEEIINADYIFYDELNEFAFNKGKIGTSKDPELSSTFIFKCKNFDGINVRLSGPGINGSKEMNLPIDDSFANSFNEKNSYYPLGNEVFFLNEKDEIIAISRTTKLEVL